MSSHCAIQIAVFPFPSRIRGLQPVYALVQSFVLDVADDQGATDCTSEKGCTLKPVVLCFCIAISF